MTESPTSSKLAKWKRPLIGGLISALLAVSSIFYAYLTDADYPVSYLSGGFSAPAYIFTEAAFYDFQIPARFSLSSLTLTFLLWFVMGASISYLIKKNWKAVGCWFLLLLICIPLFLIIMFLRYGSISA